MKMILALLAIACMIPLSSASWSWGSCPEFDVVSDLDLEKFYGTWYHLITDDTFYFSKGCSCVRAEYNPVEGEEYFQVINAAVKKGEWTFFPAKARVRNENYYEVKYPYAPWIRFQVYDTDYDKYAIIYSCHDFYLFHYTVNFFMARDQFYKPSQEQVDTMVMLGTEEKHLLFYDQNDCLPYPGYDK